MTDTVPVTMNGRWTLSLPRHRAERPEWDIANGGWETARLADMAAHLGPGDTIIDVGAEQGDLSALWASWGCATVLVEPNPLAWPNIRLCYEANDLPLPLAWWVGFASERCEHPPRCDVPTPFGMGDWPACAYGEAIGATGFRHLAQESDVTAQTTLDVLCERAGIAPTAITIDVEGSELAVLRGAKRILAEHRPTVWVSIHCDMEWMDALYEGVRKEDVYAFMAAFDYEPTELARDHELHVRLDPR